MRESIRRSLKYTFATYILAGPVAQRLEQGTHNPLVVGSNPTGPTIFCDRIAISGVENYVFGSNPAVCEQLSCRP